MKQKNKQNAQIKLNWESIAGADPATKCEITCEKDEKSATGWYKSDSLDGKLIKESDETRKRRERREKDGGEEKPT